MNILLLASHAVAEYDDLQRRIEDSGYWDLREQMWEQAGPTVPGYVPGEGYYDFRDRVTEKTAQVLVESGSAANEVIGRAMAQDIVNNKYPVLSDLTSDVYNPYYFYPWIAEHPQEALDLIRWGYIQNPAKPVEALLNQLIAEGVIK